MTNGSGTASTADVTNVSVTCGAAPTMPLADTGQTTCYDNTTSITCPTSGQAFFGQDANYTGTAKSLTASVLGGGEIVTDNVTGLIWQRCQSGRNNDATCSGGTTTQTAAGAVTFCTGLNFAGFASGWRLPTVLEYEGLLNHNTSPQVDLTVFPNHSIGTPFYLAESFNGGVDRNSILIGCGTTCEGGIQGASGGMNVRCVRGTTATISLDDLGDGTIRDNGTGLIWQKCSSGLSDATCTTGTATTYTWENALAYCEGLTFAGSSDWRLPNRIELNSIFDYSRTFATGFQKDPTKFPETTDVIYWSSTTNSFTPTTAWTERTKNESTNSILKTNSYQVRCVR